MIPLVTKSLWLEDCNDSYIKIIQNPMGIGFPDQNFPDTQKDCIKKNIHVGDLKDILEKYSNHNIWRSWEIFFDSSCEKAESCIPIFLDIDYVNKNITGAYKLASYCLNILEKDYRFQGGNRLRVIFSGRKGFHIEGRPKKPLNNCELRDQILDRLNIEEGLSYCGIKNVFKYGVIDPINQFHNFIRATGSINSWFEEGLLKRRRVIQFSLEEIKECSVEEIINKSEDI